MPHIKSIHAKDIIILPELTVHLEERRPGLGYLDYAIFLQEASKLKDIPFMLEHLETQKDYKLAADYISEVDKRQGFVDSNCSSLTTQKRILSDYFYFIRSSFESKLSHWRLELPQTSGLR